MNARGRWRDLARRSKYDPEKRRKLPEPRSRKEDENELTRDEFRSDSNESVSAPDAKTFGIRRSKRPFETAKEIEEEEESLKSPEYGKKRMTKRRHRKRT